MKKLLGILLPVVICFLIGLTASYFQSDAIQNWYPYLNKPALTPPNIVFPIAWSILYLCMGISIGLVINSSSARKNRLIGIFILQLLLNFGWSLLFFYFRSPLLGLADIILLDLAVIYYIYRSYPEEKTSAWLFVPYLAWILFATYLNAYILIFN